MSSHNLSYCLSLRMRKTSPFAAACPKFYELKIKQHKFAMTALDKTKRQ